MAVTIPPWINLDPIEPARLAAASAARRQQAAIAERAAQLRQQEMELRAQVEQAHIAQQERAAYRRQIMAEQLAQAEGQRRAEDLAMRRELHARQASQFQQTLQFRQQQAERAAAESAIQAEGSRGLQADLDAGVPIEQALPKHAGKLFYKHPERMVPALRGVTPPGEPRFGKTPGGAEYVQDPRGGVHFPPGMAGATGPVTAQQVLDESGKPIGPRVIRGSRGGIHMLSGEELKPAERIRALSTQFAILQNRIQNEGDPAKQGALLKQQETIFQQLQQLTAPKAAGKIDEAAGGEEEEAAMMDEQPPPEGVGDEGEEVPAPEEEEDMVGVGDEE